ncbi:MAG: hypothetical protein R3A10_17180 [Caldilineaceae bacterium]
MSQGIFVADDDLWTRFPGSRPLTASAGLPVEEWYHPAPPTDPDFRALRLAQVEAILTRVGHLTASGWTSSVGPRAGRSGRPLYHSSFDPVTLARFTADTGVTLPDAAPRVVGLDSRPRGRCVVGMALPEIAAFVADVAALRDRIRPAAQLGVFTIPWTGTDLDALPVPQANIRIVGQDPVRLREHADVLAHGLSPALRPCGGLACGGERIWPAKSTRPSGP